MGCRHSSVDSSRPSILPPPFRLPSMPSMLLSFRNSQICVLFVLHYEKNEHKHKEAGFGLFKKVDFKVERHEKKQERIYNKPA